MLKRRDFLILFQDGKCYLCHVAMVTKPRRGWMKRRDYATIDHVHPRSNGHGKERNTLLACRDCNEAKGDAPPLPEWLALLEKANATWDRWTQLLTGD